jgi:hypothetical protein
MPLPKLSSETELTSSGRVRLREQNSVGWFVNRVEESQIQLATTGNELIRAAEPWGNQPLSDSTQIRQFEK